MANRGGWQNHPLAIVGLVIYMISIIVAVVSKWGPFGALVDMYGGLIGTEDKRSRNLAGIFTMVTIAVLHLVLIVGIMTISKARRRKVEADKPRR